MIKASWISSFPLVGRTKPARHTVPINKDEVELFCVYCPGTDEYYRLAPLEFGSYVCLRVETSKNGQRENMNFASDFRRVP